MTKREIVYRAIDRTGPPRIPIHYCNRDFEFSDTVTVTYSPAKDFTPSVPRESEWGFVWEALDKTMGQPRSNPLRDWDCVATYIPPDPNAPGRLDDLAHLANVTEDRFIRFSLGITGFNQATFLRGFEDFLADLHSDRRFVERMLDFVFDFEKPSWTPLSMSLACVQRIESTPICTHRVNSSLTMAHAFQVTGT